VDKCYQIQEHGTYRALEPQLHRLCRQKKETADMHNFELLEQALKDEIKFGEKESAEAKKDLGTANEEKAAAEGDLKVEAKTLQGAMSWMVTNSVLAAEALWELRERKLK